MEPVKQEGYEIVNIKNGKSPSYFPNNLAIAGDKVATLTLGTLRSKILLYDANYLAEKMADVIQPQIFEFDPKNYEITHFNFVKSNGKFYFILGFVGGFEVYFSDI